MDLAYHEDPRPLTRRRVHQLHAHHVRVHVALPVLRRLVCDDRVQRQRLGRVEHLVTDTDLRPHVEEAVRQAVTEWRHVQRPTLALYLLLDLARRGNVISHADRHRATRAGPAQVHRQDLRLHLVAPVAVVVVRHALGALEHHRHRRRAHRGNHLTRRHQFHGNHAVSRDPAVPAVHRQLREHVEKAVNIERTVTQRRDRRVPQRGLRRALADHDRRAAGNRSRQAHRHHLRVPRARRLTRAPTHDRLHGAGQHHLTHPVKAARADVRHRRQRRVERLDLVRAAALHLHVRKATVGHVLQHHVQVRAVELGVHVLRRTVHPVVRRKLRRRRLHARIHQHHARRRVRRHPVVTAIHRQLREHVEEAVDVELPATDINDRRLTHRRLRRALPDQHARQAHNARRAHVTAAQAHRHHFRLERPRRLTVRLHERLHRARQAHRHRHTVHDRRAAQRRVEHLDLAVAHRVPDRRLRERPMADVLQYHVQGRAVELRVHVRRRPVVAMVRRKLRRRRHDPGRRRNVQNHRRHRVGELVDLNVTRRVLRLHDTEARPVPVLVQ